jgi:hypothetical protein
MFLFNSSANCFSDSFKCLAAVPGYYGRYHGEKKEEEKKEKRKKKKEQ